MYKSKLFLKIEKMGGGLGDDDYVGIFLDVKHKEADISIKLCGLDRYCAHGIKNIFISFVLIQTGNRR